MKNLKAFFCGLCLFLASALHAQQNWFLQTPATKPSARQGHAMASLGGDQVLLFGGASGSLYNETWVNDLSDNTWILKSPATKPAARAFHAMAYLGGDQVLLFGGFDDDANDETWVYDLSDNTWTNKNPATKPSARTRHAMAYLGGDQVLLFGGDDGYTYSDETWVYDLSANTWTLKSLATKPSARYKHPMASLGGDQVLLFGGAGGGDDTWVYDLSDNTWTLKNPATKPSTRELHALAFLDGDQVLLFGGSSISFDDETWVYDLSDNTWTLQSPATKPSARDTHAMASLGSGQVLLFGGNDGSFDNETWIYLTPSTITVTTAPAGLDMTVDGTAYTSPKIFQWVPGSSHTIATTSPQSLVPGTQHVFLNWSDAGAISHSVIAPGVSTTYTASFKTQHELTTSASVGGMISPASGFYDEGNVAITATADPGYTFIGFSGDLTGTTNPQTLNLSGPASVTANFAIAVKPLVFLANKVTLKSTKQVPSFGDIHSNGLLIVEKGNPSTYNSNLTAIGKITINKQNTINGNVKSQTSISNSGKINGTKTIGAVANESLPSLSYSAGGANKTVPNGGSLTLAPGSYGIVTMSQGGKLKLTSGEYFMNELRYSDTIEGGTIEIDLSSGAPITINVVTNLQFGHEAAVVLLPNGESDSELVTFNTMQSTNANWGREGYFLGSFNAPNAIVTLVKNSQLRGSICAKEILVSNDCLFLHHDSPGSLPGPGNLPKASFDDDDEQPATSNEQPVSYQLEQNYPNPFNPSTTISFALPQTSEVSLSIFNMSGQLVKRLVSGEMNVGSHSFTWDATNERGERVASGVYLYVIKAGSFTAQRKLVLMK